MRPLRPAILPDHELAFTRYSSVRNGGVLDIRPRSGYAVNGVLMAVTPAGWELLDMKEGVKSGAYERITARVVDAEGEWHRVTTYRVVPSNAKRHVPPHSHYVSVCAEGLRGHGLAPTHLLDAAADRPARPPAAGLFLSESMKRSFGMVLRDQDHWTLMPASGSRWPARKRRPDSQADGDRLRRSPADGRRGGRREPFRFGGHG